MNEADAHEAETMADAMPQRASQNDPTGSWRRSWRSRSSAHNNSQGSAPQRHSRLRPDQRDAMARSQTGSMISEGQSLELNEMGRSSRLREIPSHESVESVESVDYDGEEMEPVETQADPRDSHAPRPRGSHAPLNTSRANERRDFEEIQTPKLGRRWSKGLGLQRTQTGVPSLEMTRSVTRTQTVNTQESDPRALGRIVTQRMQHRGTVGEGITPSKTSERRKSRLSGPLPAFGAGKEYPPTLPDREDFVVEFDGASDPRHGQNWPNKKKILVVLLTSWSSLLTSIGSSIFSSGELVMGAKWGVSKEVSTLGTSLYVLGLAFGPIIWAPMSELFGRRVPLVISSFGFSLFLLACAVGKDLQTVFICRFFAALFGASPLVVTAACYADIYNNEQRGVGIAAFAIMVSMGPLFGPFLGGFITDSYLGWRWTMYLASILGWSAFLLLLFFLPESYPPAILVAKAGELRRLTQNWGIHAKQEEVEIDLKELIVKNTTRPLRLLFQEPIVFAVSLYMSFVYGLLYLFLTAYAVIFEQVHGFNAGVAGLPYFGMCVGEIIGFIVIVLLNRPYVKKLRANNNIPVPEWRMPIVVVGGVLYSAGLFWFGWTGYTAKIHWIAPTLSGLFTGFGFYTIFLQLLNYLVDAYLMFAASALAANTFMRSVFAATCPMFASYMFASGWGVKWTLTFLGGLAALMVPMPIFFLFRGKTLRAKSKFAPSPDIQQEQRLMDEEANRVGSNESGGSGSTVNDDKKEDA